MILFFVIAFWFLLVCAIVMWSPVLMSCAMACLLISCSLIVHEFIEKDKTDCLEIRDEGFNVILKGSTCFIESSNGLFFKNGSNKYYTKEQVEKY